MIALAVLFGIVVLALCGLFGLLPDSRDCTYALGPVMSGQRKHRRVYIDPSAVVLTALRRWPPRI